MTWCCHQLFYFYLFLESHVLDFYRVSIVLSIRSLSFERRAYCVVVIVVILTITIYRPATNILIRSNLYVNEHKIYYHATRRKLIKITERFLFVCVFVDMCLLFLYSGNFFTPKIVLDFVYSTVSVSSLDSNIFFIYLPLIFISLYNNIFQYAKYHNPYI